MTAATGGVALAGVQVTAQPGGQQTTTAADGSFSYTGLAVGAYTLTFTKTGYNDKTVAGVSVATGGATNVAVSMDTNAGQGGPTIVIQDNLLAGFNKQVVLTATVTPSADEDAAALTYSWKLTGGRPVTFTGGTTNAITFTTLDIPSVLTARSPTTYPRRFGPLGFSPDETGVYAFTLTVTDPQGHTTSATAHVQATWQAPGHSTVPIDLPAYFIGDNSTVDAGGADGGSAGWNWTLTNLPSGSTATLNDSSTQFPYFKPDKAGDYTLTETLSGKSLVVHASTWYGVMNNDSNCVGCHALGGGGMAPDKFTGWYGTAHYSAAKRKLNGEATSHFGPTCMVCHTVGLSPGSNSGWDDIATQDGWTFPTTLKAGNFEGLPTSPGNLQALASIQCESCHGPHYAGHEVNADPTTADPAGTQMAKYWSRVSWSTQVCASCHQENPAHYKPSQWATSKHADETLPPRVSTIESKNSTAGGATSPQSGVQFCARCHSAQGYAQYTKQLMNGAIGRYDFLTLDNQKLGATNAPTVKWLTNLGLTNAMVESQTCVACHDPHQNPLPQTAPDGGVGIDCTLQANNGDPACAQLRLYDNIPGLPNGQGQNGVPKIAGVGAGAVCMACHNSRNGEHTDYGPTDPTKGGPPYLETPHDSTATDVYYGFNAYWVPRLNPSPHMAVAETCAGCHYKIPTAAQVSLKQTANHSFAPDLSICATCHGSSNVDGAALQAQVANEMVGLDQAITSHVKTVLGALDWTGAGVDVQVSSLACSYTGNDGKTVTGNCSSSWIAPAVPFPNPPSNVHLKLTAAPTFSRSAGSSSVSITLPAAQSFQPVSPIDGSNAGATVSKTTISVPLKSIMFGGNYVFLPSSVTARAIWNYVLLQNEGSSGIHNFPFTNAVLGATNAALANNLTNP